MSILNGFSVDLEDWFQAVTSLNARQDEWDRFEPRLLHNTERLLALMDEYQVHGTFFILGIVAKEYPDLIRNIDRAGHEIGVHGYWHRKVRLLGPQEFSEELDRALEAITPLVNQPVIGHRAPYFSINGASLWALDVLQEKGFKYDSSFFATRNTLYGYPGSPRFPHRPNGGELVEFPLSTVRWAGIILPIAGGFYMRLFPYSLVKAGIRSLNQQGQPTIIYMHPWELDDAHRYNRVTLREWIVQYTGRGGMEGKLRKLFNDFRFVPLRELIPFFSQGLNTMEEANIDGLSKVR